MLVCGLGESLACMHGPPSCPSIGVNDIGQAFDPTYLLCMDPLEVFPGNRRGFIEGSAARFVFTSANTGIAGNNIVSCPVAFCERVRAADDSGLYHRGAPLTSVYLALELAAYMGAEPIGLIGVDFCGGYFFDPSYVHSLNPFAGALNVMFSELGRALALDGVRVVNLSDRSVLTGIPQMGLDGFFGMERVTARGSIYRPPAESHR